MNQQFTGILFDMDGVLVESEASNKIDYKLYFNSECRTNFPSCLTCEIVSKFNFASC